MPATNIGCRRESSIQKVLFLFRKLVLKDGIDLADVMKSDKKSDNLIAQRPT